jgi:hypothetical protein
MRIHSPQITGSAENTNIVTITRITSLTALSASFASTASFVQNAQSASFAVTASHLLGQSPTSSYALTASFVLNAISSSFAATASSADNLTVRGILTAQTINVQTITSSIEFVTGSTRNGSLLANTHQFTGSVSVTGSLQVNNLNVILSNQTSSMSVATASYWSGSIQNATSASYALTASYLEGYISPFPFTGSANITGSLNVVGTVSASHGISTPLITNNGKNWEYLASGQMRPAGTIMGSSYDSNQIDVSGFTMDIKSLIYGLNITTSPDNGVNSYIWNYNTNGTLTAPGGITAPSFTGSLQGTSSYALQANSASFALTASYISGSGGGVGFPFSGSAIITGSLFVSGSTISGSFKGDGSQITGLTAGGKIHTQTSAASTWTVSHNLGVQYPNVTVYDNNNNVIIPQTIVATDANTLTLTFGSAVAGYTVVGIGGIINVQGRTTQQYFTASTTWSFAHNLGDKYVSLQAFDDAFEMMIPTTIRLVDFTSSLLLFDSASSGYAVATIGGDLPAISSSYAGFTLQVASSSPYSASWVAVPNVTVTTAQTASYANNFTVGGTLTAQTINVQTITSSIDYVTGSAKFGSLSTNTHQFTGSVLMSGSLGIGTNSPSAQLHIYGKAGNIFTDGLKITRSEQANQYLVLNYEGGIINLVAVDSQFQGPQFRFMTSIDGSNATERVRFTKDGYVGIGTSSPEGPLHISGSNAGGYIGMAITNYNGAAGTSAGIDFGVDPSATYNGSGNGQILVTSTGGAATTYKSEMLLKTWNGSSLITSIKISDTGRVSFPAATAQSYGVSNATAVTVNTATPTTIASVTITTTGKPVLLVASGDGNPNQAGGWHNLRLYRDSTPIGKLIISENAGGDSANCPFALTHIDTPSAGTYTYTVKAWQGSGSFLYGETGNDQAPTLCVVELL